MSNDFPLYFDPALFAQQQRIIKAEIGVGSIPRISEFANHLNTSLVIEFSFSKSSLGFAMVKGVISGSVVQTCQRCMHDVEVDIKQLVHLIMVKPQQMELAQREGVEMYEYDGQSIETVNLIADEVILGLPIVVKHEHLDQCDPKTKQWLQGFNDKDKESHRDNPFAQLKDLKIK